MGAVMGKTEKKRWSLEISFRSLTKSCLHHELNSFAVLLLACKIARQMSWIELNWIELSVIRLFCFFLELFYSKAEMIYGPLLSWNSLSAQNSLSVSSNLVLTMIPLFLFSHIRTDESIIIIITCGNSFHSRTHFRSMPRLCQYRHCIIVPITNRLLVFVIAKNE